MKSCRVRAGKRPTLNTLTAQRETDKKSTCPSPLQICLARCTPPEPSNCQPLPAANRSGSGSKLGRHGPRQTPSTAAWRLNDWDTDRTIAAASLDHRRGTRTATVICV